MELGARIGLGASDAQRRDGLVDRAVRHRPGSVLADTPTVEQPGGAVIAGARVHLPRRAAHRRRSLLLLSGDVASLLSYPVVIVSPMRMVHRTARVRLLVTPAQARRCYRLLRAGGDIWAALI